ncbi:uncharacterized protein LOC143025816 [Oratosquilla oratoria]|uniref:uncharacterized protein LOC143025816 n=1 Tax=Oratosquilla oratoria TaxID=337810 RepID=UPI003F76AB25
MRPITSGIGSTPHRLEKCLAKPISNTIGSISGAHLSNSSDLIRRLENLNVNDKKLASFDVTTSFTIVSINDALKAVKKVTTGIDDYIIPVPRSDYLKLVSMCVRFGYFMFNNKEFRQIRGLVMGSPLSAVIACLFMEELEMEKCINIMVRDTIWLKSVDDIIVLFPKTTNVEKRLRRLNAKTQLQSTIVSGVETNQWDKEEGSGWLRVSEGQQEAE